MRFVETGLEGAWTIELDRYEDERGFFARSFCEREFEKMKLAASFVQCNVSWNHRTGTVRGMHWQTPPHAEAKLVRCTAGAIFDVIVDVRPSSPTRHGYYSVELNAENHRMLFIPDGFAHGFQTLRDGTEVFYQMSDFHVPNAARGFRWNDPQIDIPWPQPLTIISDRDRALPLLAEINEGLE